MGISVCFVHTQGAVSPSMAKVGGDGPLQCRFAEEQRGPTPRLGFAVLPFLLPPSLPQSFSMQHPQQPSAHHIVPLSHGEALILLRKNRHMWIHNPGLPGNHVGLEQVLLNAEIAIDAEFEITQDVAQRDENVRERLKQAERALEAVSYWL